MPIAPSLSTVSGETMSPTCSRLRCVGPTTVALTVPFEVNRVGGELDREMEEVGAMRDSNDMMRSVNTFTISARSPFTAALFVPTPCLAADSSDSSPSSSCS
jgi:hypothetical protein